MSGRGFVHKRRVGSAGGKEDHQMSGDIRRGGCRQRKGSKKESNAVRDICLFFSCKTRHGKGIMGASSEGAWYSTVKSHVRR